MASWATLAPALTASFLASLVEMVEAFTILLAVGVVSGWKIAIGGAFAGLATLALLVAVLGPAIGDVPLYLLQILIGTLLLLFGLRWLRKAILRAAGLIPLHDEAAAFVAGEKDLREAQRRGAAQQDWIAALTAYKAVTIEGVEVVFIVIAVGAGRGLIIPAAVGAVAAFLLVLAIGIAIHRPLAQVPENTLKFAVGIVLSAFGLFWTGEGLGLDWPGGDAAVLLFAVLFLALSLLSLFFLHREQAAQK